MAKRYVVTLTAEERDELTELVRVGKGKANERLHAQIILKADQGDGGPAWTDAQIADAFGVRVRTVERVRERLVEGGLQAAVRRKPQARPSRERLLDGRAEARLVQLACSEPPAGAARWTLRLLAGRLVELEVVESVSHETVRRVLKKTT